MIETDIQSHRLVKVMADSSNKRVLLSIFCFGLALLVTMYVISAFAIPTTFFYIVGLDNCPEDFSTFKGFCHSFSLRDDNVWESYLARFDKKNAFLVISGMVERDAEYLGVDTDIELDFKAIIIAVDDSGVAENDQDGFGNAKQHKLVVHCEKDSRYCEESGFVLNPRITSRNYYVSIQIELDSIYKPLVKGMRFFAKTQNPAYTSYLLGVRYACLIISLVFSSAYLLFFRQIKPEFKTFEHKFILVLSIALIFFNDPIYAATMLTASTWLTILSALFVVVFIGLLIFFWIVMVQRIHKESIRVTTQLINSRNVALGVATFLVLAALTFFSSLVEHFDPAYHVDSDYPLAYKVLSAIAIVILASLMAVYVYNSYKVLRAWNKVIPRHRFLFLFSFYFVVALFFLIATGLYQSTDFNGARVLMIFVLFTFYVIVLQLMWRFDRNSQKHFIDVRNLDQSNARMTSKHGVRDLGMNYFSKDCEVEITKINGFYQPDDSSRTERTDDLSDMSRSRDISNSKSLDDKNKSVIDDKLLFDSIEIVREHSGANDGLDFDLSIAQEKPVEFTFGDVQREALLGQENENSDENIVMERIVETGSVEEDDKVIADDLILDLDYQEFDRSEGEEKSDLDDICDLDIPDKDDKVHNDNTGI